MKLVIDTTTNTQYLALLDGENLVDEVIVEVQKDHSEIIVNNITNLLTTNEITYQDITEVYVVNGPGSYTGVRVGVTVAKTIAFAGSVSAYTCSTLQMMANGVGCGIVAPLIDARREHVFGSIVEFNGDDANVIVPEGYYSVEELIKLMPEGTKVIGSGANMYQEHFSNQEILDIKLARPQASSIIKNAIKVDNVHNLNPNYLKLTQAEEQFNSAK